MPEILLLFLSNGILADISPVSELILEFHPNYWLFTNVSRNMSYFMSFSTVKGFSIVNETEVDVFLEPPCFLHEPMNVANLIFGSSAFSKHSLYI